MDGSKQEAPMMRQQLAFGGEVGRLPYRHLELSSWLPHACGASRLPALEVDGRRISAVGAA